MINFSKISKFWCGLLLIFGLLAIAAVPVHAATVYDVTNVELTPAVTTGQYVQLAEDLQITWSMPTSSDTVMGYYLKFTTTSDPLPNPDPVVANYDYATLKDKNVGGQIVATTDKKFTSNTKSIKELNTGDVNYLHIVTQYLDNSTDPPSIAYSDYVLLNSDGTAAEIRIDNVAPTGGLTLNPTTGPSKNVIVESMSFTEPIKEYWLISAPSLSSAPSFPGGDGTPYVEPLAVALRTVPLQSGAVAGDLQTIYAWFEDYAGNRTTAASAAATYDYKAAIAILGSTSDLAVTATRVFTVDSSTHYNWEITSSVPGVAYVQGTTVLTLADSASLTVEGKAVGTFTVKATPTPVGSAPLPVTDPITVVQTIAPGDVDNDGEITLDDVKLTFGFFLGATSTSQQFAAANVYDDGDGISLQDVKGVFTLFLGGTL